MTTIYTAGHSNTPVEALVAMLQASDIRTLADIRRYPSSRRNPQFNAAALSAALREAGIDYRHFEALGGRRDAEPESPNLALHSDGLRGYADYALTEPFDAAITQLVALADQAPTVVMCAEANPLGCHRSVLADSLTARGHEVIHLVGTRRLPHQLSPLARVVDEGRVVYPALL